MGVPTSFPRYPAGGLSFGGFRYIFSSSGVIVRSGLPLQPASAPDTATRARNMAFIGLSYWVRFASHILWNVLFASHDSLFPALVFTVLMGFIAAAWPSAKLNVALFE